MKLMIGMVGPHRRKNTVRLRFPSGDTRGSRDCLGLALETCAPIGIERKRFGQYLQGDLPVEASVARAVDLAHATGTTGVSALERG